MCKDEADVQRGTWLYVKLLGWVYMGEAVYRGEFGVHR